MPGAQRVSGGETGRVVLRLAGEQDAVRVAALAGQLGYLSEEGAVLERLRAIAGQPDHAAFVAETAGEVVGWVHVCAVTTLEAPAHAEIGGLVVATAHRGRGIGRRLMEAAEDWARGKGSGSVRLRSNVVHAEAHAFYEGVGYTVVKTQKVFAKTLQELPGGARDQP